MTEDKNTFPAGSYVVLLSTCTGIEKVWSKMPINHVYKLKEASNTYLFCTEADSWRLHPTHFNTSKVLEECGKLKLRLAMEVEIKHYDKSAIDNKVPSVESGLYSLLEELECELQQEIERLTF